ncbi:MAG: adenylosuccinate lyase, partial [Oscillospiraceae bacterium]|nr:adenylosuccinate lyase [Oscillospiraceae bacterium]
ERYIDIFRTGQAALEQHTPTCNELVYRILCRICREIEEEQREWKFAALSPREQAAELERARKASEEWKQHMKAIKAQLRGVSSSGDEPREEIRT